VRRTLAGLIAFLALTTTVLVLPVYAAPLPDAHPVETGVDDVALGSVIDPAPEAVVATDGEVQPGGVEATAGPSATPTTGPATGPSAEQTGESAATESAASSAAPTGDPEESAATEAPAEPGEPVVSGDELPGVPALTVSRPDTDVFSTVGITWQQDPAVTDVVAQIRTKDAQGAWSEWTTLATDDAEQTPSETTSGVVRSGTAPYWTDEAHGVEAIVQGADGQVPQDVRLTLLDPGSSAADALPTDAGPSGQAHAAVAMPAVITRAQWGADEHLRTWGPQYASTIKAATIHHTDNSNAYSADDVPAMMRSIYTYHAQTRGWGDIGYNVIVDKFGRIFEGRYGGLQTAVIAAHAGGFNTYTFGVSMLGNYESTPVPEATLNAVEDIIAWKFALFRVDPNGRTVLTSGGGGTAKYVAGTQVTLPTIFAHRDVGATSCPGTKGYASLAAIRAGVAARSGDSAFVQSLYQDMLGRSADVGGLNGWVSSLATGKADRRGISRGFSNSTEYRTLSIAQAYRQVFNREPDPGGMNTWMGYLSSGALRIDALRPTLMASTEFYLRGGSSDAAFVDNIYRAALNRGAQAWEVEYWSEVRREKGPQSVIATVWGSPEAAMRRVDQAYTYYLGRSAGRSEQESWLPVIMGAGDEQLREEVMSSLEYYLRAVARFP
jgi:hypothetical protein